MEALLQYLKLHLKKVFPTEADTQQPLSVANVFSDNMVLQRDARIAIWGKAQPKTQIQITFNTQALLTSADKKGDWLVHLAPLSANSQGDTLRISDSLDIIQFINVVVGEVWICSGQSNMGWTLDLSEDAELHIQNATNPDIRFLAVPVFRSEQMETSIQPSQWASSHPHHARFWSAVGYHFAVKLQQELQLPIGIIWASLGATKIQEWTSKSINALHAYDIPEEWNNNASSNLFNGMIAPLIPYTIRGVAWYQGEENHWGAGLYHTQQAAMIEDWRERWGQGSFPFVYVQLANYGQTNSEPWSAWAELQEAQLQTLSHPNTAMAVAVDVGEANDIHPRRKQPVGERLAIAALGIAYQQLETYTGPLFKSFAVEGNKIRISFDHVGEGLETTDNQPLRWFEIAEKNPIAGKNARFHPAIAEIDGDTVLIHSETITNPIAARYAFNNNPEGCNLCNSTCLPASPFRTSNDWSATLGNNPKRPIKQVPVAIHKRINAVLGTPISVELQGHWCKNTPSEARKFKLISKPKMGDLKGVAPNLIYHPHAEKTGTDRFTYRVSNQFSTSNLATIIIDVNNNQPAI